MVEHSILTTGDEQQMPNPAVDKLKRLAAKGAVWTFAGYGTQQILRFVIKIILARLLLTSIFGLSAIVDTFILGLTFFSDIGINFSIIRNKRGEETIFLNTAWTMQIIRGVGLFLFTLLFAPLVSNYYGYPVLLYVLPIAGLAALANGFNSTNLATANRKLLMRPLTILELVVFVIGRIVMIVWALLSPSIWAIVAGNLTTHFLRAILSHIVLPGERNKLAWERQTFDEIYHFGRWIFVSSSLAFLAIQSDRLIIAKLMPLSFVGIYSIALILANMVNQGIMQIGHKVFFPSYSKLVRNDPDRLYGVLRQSRIAMITLNTLAALLFLSIGPWLIPTLFGENFAAAGWMLQIISVGTLLSVLSVTYDHVLIAKEQTKAVAALFALQFLIQATGLVIGANIAGEIGVVIAVAAAGWLIYPFKAFWMWKNQLWQPEVDLPAIALAITVALFTIFIIF